jgi:hypothetical protein
MAIKLNIISEGIGIALISYGAIVLMKELRIIDGIIMLSIGLLWYYQARTLK